MTIDEIRFEMDLNDVKPTDIEAIIEECRHSGFSSEELDEALQKKGYPKIFTIDYDAFDTYDEDAWEDD